MSAFLDSLDSANIPPSERFDWQPSELVAVLGEHAWRHWGDVRYIAFCADGRRVASVGADGLRVWDRRAGTATPRELFFLPCRCRLIALSPDWQVLVTVEDSDEGTEILQVWNLSGAAPASVAQEGGSESTLAQPSAGKPSPAGLTTAVAVHPSTGLLAVGRADGVIRIRKGAQGGGGWGLKLHTGTKSITALAFSPDERLLAVGLTDGSVQLWELLGPLPRPAPAYQASTEEVSSLSFNPDGGVLAVACRSGAVRLLRILNLRVCADCSVQAGGGADAVSFAPDGGLLAVWVDGEGTRVYDVTGLIPELVWELDNPKQHTFLSGQPVAFAPTGTTLALGHENGVVALWDLNGDGPRPVNPLRGQVGSVNCLVFSPDGGLLASSAGPAIQAKDRFKNNPIRVWSLKAGGNGKPMELEGGGPLAFSVDGETLAGCDEKKLIRLWKREGDSFRPSHVLARGSAPSRGGASGEPAAPEGPAELTFLDRKIVQIRDVAQGAPVSAPGPKLEGTILAGSPDGKWVVTGQLTGVLPTNELQTVTIWSLHDRQPISQGTLEVRGEVLALSPDGAMLVSSTCGGTVMLWKVGEKEPVRHWRFPGRVFGAAFAHDGRHLALGNANGTIYVLRLSDSAPRGRRSLVGTIAAQFPTPGESVSEQE